MAGVHNLRVPIGSLPSFRAKGPMIVASQASEPSFLDRGRTLNTLSILNRRSTVEREDTRIRERRHPKASFRALRVTAASRRAS